MHWTGHSMEVAGFADSILTQPFSSSHTALSLSNTRASVQKAVEIRIPAEGGDAVTLGK